MTMLSSASLLAHIPNISITSPTPPRPTAFAHPEPKTTSTAASSAPPAYRLLYRGALSLPDSLMLLDGLTFAARLDSPSKQSTFHLLENPLALALESMRGRPSLRLIGTVSLGDVYLDESGRVEMDIHPLAILSQIYFENMFCLLPFTTPSTSQNATPDRSEIGIKVALGDSNGPETTEIIIFAQRTGASSTIRLHVGRVAQRPVASQAHPRGPRPDDPIPRKPPAFFIRDLKRTGSLGGVVGAGRELKRVASGSTLGVGAPKKQKTAGVAADLGSGVRLGAPDGGAVFKVPELPRQAAKGKGKEKEKEKDVFGDVSEVSRAASSAKGAKQKGEDGDEAALEKANKNLVKRSTIEYLGQTKDPTDPARVIDKTHPEFKDLYGFIYRGVVFALRGTMRTCNIEPGIVSNLISTHASMYLGGHGVAAAN